MTWFFVGMFVGCLVGVVLMSLCAISKERDDEFRDRY